MAVTVERAYGRARLIDVICDPRRFLATYNDAARAHNATHTTPTDVLPLWSTMLLRALAGN